MTSENTPQTDHRFHNDLLEDSAAETLNQAIDNERIKLRDAIVTLSKIATLTIADTYSTEDMGVEFLPGYREQIMEERIRLNETLGDVSRLFGELNNAVNELQRGVGSLQYLIDPENN